MRGCDGALRVRFGPKHFLGEAEAVTGPDPFPTELLDRFRELVPCEFVGYCELDRVERQLLLYEGCENTEPLTASASPRSNVYWRLRDQHPSCRYQERTLDFASRKLSDFLTSGQLHRLEIYEEWFQPFGVEYELVAGLPAPLSHTKVFLFDSARRDFSETRPAPAGPVAPALGLSPSQRSRPQTRDRTRGR